MIRQFCKSTVAILIRLLYCHRIYGKEHLPEGGGLIAANHCSFLDPPILGASYPGAVHFLARDTLFHFAPFGWLLRQLNTHPVKRGGGNLETFKMALDFVMKGKKVVIFPEGFRSPDGNLQKGKLGVGMLVQRTKCQVVPVYVHGTYALWSKGQRLPKLWGQTACVFGSPIPYEENEALDKKEAQGMIVEKIMERIAALRDWYLNGAEGTPP